MGNNSLSLSLSDLAVGAGYEFGSSVITVSVFSVDGTYASSLGVTQLQTHVNLYSARHLKLVGLGGILSRSQASERKPRS